MAATTAGAAAEKRDPVPLDTREDLLAVDPPHHDVGAAHPRHRVRHAPAVAVEHRQRMEQHVAIAHARVPPERGRVEPAVAVSELDPLRASGRARGVVDRARGVLVGLPRSGRCSRGGRCEQRGVVDPVEAEAVIDLDAVHLAGQIGVVEEDRRPRMADDVGDLVGGEPEVDRHQDAAETADPEEGGQEPARVRADDGHAFSVPDPELVEGEGHATSARLELAVGLRPERTGDRRLVLHGSSVAIDERGPLQEIAHRQRDPHVPPISRTRFYPTGTLVARLRPSRGFPCPPAWALEFTVMVSGSRVR